MANKYTKLKIDLDKAKKLYESGMTQEEVGKELGTTQKVIYERFKQAGYKSRIAKKSNQNGPNNDSWKGDEAGYKALHYRVTNARGTPKLCEDCGTTTAKRYEWANMTKNYSDILDYKRLCKDCHHAMDRKSHQTDEQGRFVKMGGDAE